MSFNLPQAPVDLGGTVHVRYVRPAGSDASDGLSPATAWATFVYACSQLMAYTKNGVQVIDITGIAERLPDNFKMPQVISDTQFLAWSPGFLAIAGAVTVHSDLVPFLTLAPGDISSITQDPTNFQDTINITISLVPGVLKGKFVSQFGTQIGVVKSNTDSSIEVTSSGLNSSFPITISDTGANLSSFGVTFGPTITIRNALCSVLFEGIELAAPQGSSPALRVIAALYGVGVAACKVAGLSVTDTPDGMEFLYIFYSYLLPSDGGFSAFDLPSPALVQNVFVDGLSLDYADNFAGGAGIYFATCAFHGCGPLFGGNAEPLIGRGECSSCEILNPTGPAFQMQGQGIFIINSTTINGCASPCILANGPMAIYLNEIPAGTGNLAFGITAEEGANVEASATVLISGTSGDTSLGTLGATSWAAITAAANNRISDFGANGDGSSIRRTP
jgi:hypothetical protein